MARRRHRKPPAPVADVLAEPEEAPGRNPSVVVAWVVLALTVGFVIWELHPRELLANTTPVSFDLGAHVHEPAYLRDHVFPRLSGWSPDAYAGYPIGTFYFPLGGLLIALLGYVLPYNIAFKLVAASGAIALPVAAYAFARLTRRSHLTAACFAVATLPLLLEPIVFFGGGSIGATAYGEFNYELGLAVGLVALGAVWRALENGRHRTLAAILVAVTMLIHLIPGGFVLVGAAVLLLVQPTAARLRGLATIVLPAVALTGFWIVPFVLRRDLTSGAEFPKAAPIPTYLFPRAFMPMLLLAGVGAVLAGVAFARRVDRNAAALLVTATIIAITFAVMPASRVWNGRLLGFWFLTLGLLGGIALAVLGRWIDDLRRKRARGRPLPNPRLGAMAVPCVALLLVPLLWPTPVAKGLLHTRQRLTVEQANLSSFVQSQYGGYQRSELNPDYRRLITTFRRVGATNGCGRVQWEWPNDFYQEDVLFLLLPYWTDGCLASIFGLFVESSATSPFPLVTNSHVAADPHHLQPGLPYGRFDLDRGITQMRLLGVRYYMATSAQARAAADANPALHRVATVASTNGYPWSMYEVSNSRVVEPLAADPVVSSSLDGRWQAGALDWFQQATPASSVLAADGPASWPRRSGPDATARAAPATTVSRVRLGRDTVSFHVDRPGTPVLVRVSYFPNWQADGARGPWRVTPNFMVVVPTDNDVTLRYGYTGVELLGWLMSLLGLVGVILLFRQDRKKSTESQLAPQRAGA